MRPILASDLDLAVRALLAICPNRQAELAREILARADAADRYRKHRNQTHPQFGNGSIMAVALGMDLAPLPDRCDRRYLEALSVLIGAIRCRQDRATPGCN